MSDDIFTAAEQNNVKRLEELLADGTDPNEQDWSLSFPTLAPRPNSLYGLRDSRKFFWRFEFSSVSGSLPVIELVLSRPPPIFLLLLLLLLGLLLYLF